MDPLARFEELYALAKATPGQIEPNGMTLSTVDPQGRPSARVVLLKGVDQDGLVFYTNTLSRKGLQLRQNPNVALTFWWPHIEWQIRFEGTAARVSEAEADAYFATRPRGSQLGAWASHQSDTLQSRTELEQRLEEITRKYEGREVPRPPHWSGYRVTPLGIEFWRNRQSRLHDRELYERDAPGAPWRMRMLNP